VARFLSKFAERCRPGYGYVSADGFDIAISLLVAGRGNYALLAVCVKNEAKLGRWLPFFRGRFDHMGGLSASLFVL
jgi:hypothetical protein